MPLAIFTLAIGATVSLNNRSEEVGAKAATGDYVINFWNPSNLSDTSTSDLVNLAYVNEYSNSAISSVSSVTRTYQKRKGGIGIGSSKSPSGGFTLKLPTQVTSVNVYATNWTGTETPSLAVAGQTAKTIDIQNSTIDTSTNIDNLTPYHFSFSATDTIQFSSSGERLVIYQIVMSGSTGSISIANPTERVKLSNSLVLTPTLFGTGTLEASVTDESVASISVSSTQITINALKIGATQLTATYGGSQAQVNLIVYEPTLTIDKPSASVKPQKQVSITATPVDFIPTTFSWVKTDPNSLLTLTDANTATATFLAGELLGVVQATVEASDGSITKIASVTITIAETPDVYTITSATTTYNGNPTIANLNVDKSNTELDDISLTDINTFRLGATATGDSSVNTKLLFGGNESTPGSARFTLPAGLIATSVKLTGITRATDTATPIPTLSINGSLKYTYNASVTEITAKVYSNSLLIASANKRLWVGAIEITAKSINDAAIDFGTYMLTKTDAECSNLSVLTATWNDLVNTYSGADQAIKTIIQSTSVNNEGNDLEKAMGRYEFIRAKYGYSNFILGGTSPVVQRDFSDKSNSNLAIITLISMIGLSSIAGYYFLNKKKRLD